MNLIAYAGLLSVALAELASSRLAAQADSPIDTTRWVLVNISPDGIRDYIDTTTVQRAGDTVTAWVEHRWSHPQHARSVRYTWTLVRSAFDCAHAQLMDLYLIAYDGPTETQTLSEAALGGWRPIAPGTVGERESAFACSLPPRAAPR